MFWRKKKEEAKVSPMNVLGQTLISLPVFKYEIVVRFVDDMVSGIMQSGFSESEAKYHKDAAGVFFPAPNSQEPWADAIFIFHGSGEKTLGNCAHEASHAVRSILTRRGVALDDEVVAYHIGYITEQMAQLWGEVETRRRSAR